MIFLKSYIQRLIVTSQLYSLYEYCKTSVKISCFLDVDPLFVLYFPYPLLDLNCKESRVPYSSNSIIHCVPCEAYKYLKAI